jgi:hypothetical protein
MGLASDYVIGNVERSEPPASIPATVCHIEVEPEIIPA